ncbi:hypothetical protein BC829DRAFT_80240 [Chytridium lagenaria]|nr:hypothetical protein BC829DRAFT_80240 [Chytridium lagenaria]
MSLTPQPLLKSTTTGLLARLNIAAASYTASNNSNNNTSLQSLLSLPLPDPKYNADDDDLLNDAEFFPPPPPEQPGLRSMHDSREKDGEKGENGKRVKVGKGTSPVSEASSGAATPTVARHFNGPKHNQTPETAMTTIPDNTEETDTITNLIHDTFPSPPHSPSSPTAPPTSSTPHPTPPTYFNDPTDPLESRTRSSSMATTLRRLSFEPSPPLPHPCSPKWWVFDTAPARVTDDPLSQYIVGVTRSHPSTSPEFRESPAMKRLLPSPPSIDSDAHLSPRLVLKAPQTTTVDEYIEWVDTVDAAIRHRRTRRPTISSDTDDDHDDTGTMVLIDLSTLRRVITRSTQNTSTQPDVSSCHPSHQKDPSPRQPSIQLDAKSLDHLSKLVALATDLDEMAGIEETEEVANPPSKFGTWGEGSNRQSRAFPNHRFSTGFFSPPSSSTHKRISMSVWKPPQNDEKEQMDDEDGRWSRMGDRPRYQSWMNNHLRISLQPPPQPSTLNNPHHSIFPRPPHASPPSFIAFRPRPPQRPRPSPHP